MLQVWGDVTPKGVLLHDRNIQFREDMAESAQRRYRHTADDKLWLARQGFRAVNSSNVSALGVFGDDLYIRFLNSAVYRYPKNAELFDVIMRSISKGRAVWRHIRRAGVPYERVGDIPIPEKIETKDLFNQVERSQRTAYEDLVKFKVLSQAQSMKDDAPKIDELIMILSPMKTLN